MQIAQSALMKNTHTRSLIIMSLLVGVVLGTLLHPFIYAPVDPLPDPLMGAATSSENTAIAQVEETLSAPIIEAPPIPTQKPLRANEREDYVLELFAPSVEEASQMQQQTSQSQRLEQTMLMAYLLTNCNLMSQAEYKQTYQALLRYLQADGADNAAKMAQDAAKRASASYQLVYRYVPCEDVSLIQTAQNLAAWRKQALGG
jgi:hypothetical protein